MSVTTWDEYVSDLGRLLSELSAQNALGQDVPTDQGFDEWVQLTLTLKKNKRIIYLVGNGASASLASHMAADLAKNGRLHTEVLTDQCLITAVSNDIDFESVFSDPLSVRASKGDMLVAISSSGSSPNILKAAEEAKKHGMSIITLSAMNEDNPLRATGMLNFYIPAGTYGNAESTHAAVLHHWMDMIECSKDEG